MSSSQSLTDTRVRANVRSVRLWLKHIGAEAFRPLVDGVVDKALLYTRPHVNQTALQIVQILDICLVNPVLHNAPDLVVYRIKVWVIQRPQIWQDKCWRVRFQKIDGVTCRVCRGTVLLKNSIFETWRFTSAVMSLRCGGVCNDHFVANFVPSLAVKDLWKSLNISRSYRHE